MRQFMLVMETEVEFVGGDGTDSEAQNYEENLAAAVKEAATKVLLRAVQGSKVAKVQVCEVKNLITH